MTNTCDIRFDGHRYYIGVGCCRKNAEFKTLAGAHRAATRMGLEITNAKEDPREAYAANADKTKIVTNLLSGRLVRIGVNTPGYCDPSSEAYWSM